MKPTRSIKGGFKEEGKMKRVSGFFLAIVLLGFFIPLSNVHAFFTFTSIDYPGATNTAAFGVNDSGHTVGQYKDAEGNIHAFFHDGTSFTALDYPGAAGTVAFDLNNSDGVVGYYEDAEGNIHALFYDGTTFTSFDYPGAAMTFASGVNDSNGVVGWYEDTEGNSHGFLYNGTAFITLDYPGGYNTEVVGVNNWGQIVGCYEDAAGDLHGFYSDGTTFVTLDYPGGYNTEVIGINDSGEIVGCYEDVEGNGHGFLYDGVTFTRIDYPGACTTIAWRPNNSVQIVGWYYDADSRYHGFLATKHPNWEKAYANLLEDTTNLTVLRKYRDSFLAKRLDGKFYTVLLYRNSQEALMVLLDNPDLMEEAKGLIERNKGAVSSVIRGETGVISNTAEIGSFLTRFARKSPEPLKWLALAVKRALLQNKRREKPFLGFELE